MAGGCKGEETPPAVAVATAAAAVAVALLLLRCCCCTVAAVGSGGDGCHFPSFWVLVVLVMVAPFHTCHLIVNNN